MSKRALTVVIVEDERLIARHLQQTLQREGHTVLGTATNADDALALCAAQRPDTVLMDIRLEQSRVGQRSSMDGIDTAQRLLDDHGLRVIYLTAGADVAVMDRAKRTRPYAYLLKPINIPQLLGALEIVENDRST